MSRAMPWPTLQELLARTVLDPDTGCHLWQGAKHGTTGYGAVNRRGVVRGAHRLAWIAAYGPIPPGLMVQHVCDVPACINPDHLSLGTALSNARQATHRGRHVALRGENSPKALLTDQDVADIRALYAAGHRAVDLADDYQVTDRYIHQLVTNQRRPPQAPGNPAGNLIQKEI